MTDVPRIAVVGVVVQDRIESADGSTATGLGGLAYSVSALAALGGADVQVLPVCRVADDTREAVDLEWDRYPNVSKEALLAWTGPGSRVDLTYRSGGSVGGDRDECLRWPTPPLECAEIEPLLECDAILINCITGAVLTRAALRLVAALPVPIHLDVHSLVLGIDPAGRRYPRRPADWRAWLESADSLQCNEQEASVLAGESRWNRATEGFIRGLVDSRAGPRLVVVTRAAKGASLYRTGRPPLDLAAPDVDMIDPTGAGDAFGAAFVVERLRGCAADLAVRRAVEAATASCRMQGTRALSSLPRAAGATA
jgi:sugar/nucleoside kinase (ribokinase family)